MSKEKLYVIHASDYMSGSPGHMFKEYAESYIDIIKGLIGMNEYDTEEEMIEDLGLSENYDDKEVIDYWDNMNGDGMPYYIIFDVEDNKVVSGGD